MPETKKFRIQLRQGAGNNSFTDDDGHRKIVVGGQTFLSTLPLHLRWPEKFMEVPESVKLSTLTVDDGYIPPLPNVKPDPKPKDVAPVDLAFNPDAAGLDGLTLDELKKVVVEEKLDVDLSKVKTKEDAVKAIKAKFKK